MFTQMFRKSTKGFTLIEILVVIGIIAVLAAIVIVAINPARQFAQARNSQRTSNVNAILNAVGQNIADHKGVFTCDPVVTIATTPSVSSIGTTTGAGFADLEDCLVPTYLPSMIMDPKGGTNANTKYTINTNAAGRITVCAPEAALESAISDSLAICVTR